MNSLNYDVIASVCNWLEKGDAVFFVTVLQTWGASPRPEGSLFAYNATKTIQVGSLSGGCIEEDLVGKLNQSYLSSTLANTIETKHQEAFFLKRYGDSEGDGEQYLLPCGGVLELLIEPLKGDIDYKHFSELKQYLSCFQRIARQIHFDTKDKLYRLLTEEQVSLSDKIISFKTQKKELYHRLDPSYQLLIIGAGDVTNYLADIAKSLEFKVSICEPRAAYNSRIQFNSDKVDFKTCLPDDLIRSDFLSSHTAIVCLAHDPKIDDMALLEALTNSDAFYIGAMGSKKTTQNRITRLKSLGLSASQLAKLRAPIGIHINSKTPQEIAISILADLINARHSHKFNL